MKKIICDNNGIHIKKLFRSRKIPYGDIKSVGNIVKDIPEEAKFDADDRGLYSFSCIWIAVLIGWDGSGKYVADEHMEREMWEGYLARSLNHLFENYVK